MEKLGILELKALVEIKSSGQRQSDPKIAESSLPIYLVNHSRSLTEKGLIDKWTIGSKPYYELSQKGEKYLELILDVKKLGL